MWEIPNTTNRLVGLVEHNSPCGFIGEELPEGFQTAEFMLEHGFIDKIVDRENMKETISKIIKFNK